jgi:hypothetical protein
VQTVYIRGRVYNQCAAAVSPVLMAQSLGAERTSNRNRAHHKPKINKEGDRGHGFDKSIGERIQREMWEEICQRRNRKS